MSGSRNCFLSQVLIYLFNNISHVFIPEVMINARPSHACCKIIKKVKNKVRALIIKTDKKNIVTKNVLICTTIYTPSHFKCNRSRRHDSIESRGCLFKFTITGNHAEKKLQNRGLIVLSRHDSKRARRRSPWWCTFGVAWLALSVCGVVCLQVRSETETSSLWHCRRVSPWSVAHQPWAHRAHLSP